LAPTIDFVDRLASRVFQAALPPALRLAVLRALLALLIISDTALGIFGFIGDSILL